jgi:hypothetical protein
LKIWATRLDKAKNVRHIKRELQTALGTYLKNRLTMATDFVPAVFIHAVTITPGAAGVPTTGLDGTVHFPSSDCITEIIPMVM